MNKSLSLAAVAIIIFAAGCKDQNFKKIKGSKLSLEYKIIDGDGSEPVKYGNAIQFKAYYYYNDSLMSTPFDTVSQVIEMDSTKLPKEYIDIFTSAKKGDSIITRTLTDSIEKFSPLPPFAKKGNYLGYHFRITDVITDMSKVAALKSETMENMRKVDSISTEKQKSIDDKTISDYLAKNNIKATKTPKGTYVEIITPGDGPSVDSGKAVTVDYKGMTLAGKEFDSSYDSTGKSIKPFTFVVGQRGSIEGFGDGLVYFKKGGKGRLFIPSNLAYGSRGSGPDIGPNTPLMFEVNVLDVSTQDAYRSKMEAQQKMMQEQMKKMQGGQNNNDSAK